MTQNQIIQRLDRLERQLGELQRKIGASPASKKRSWRDFVGMFHNDQDFKEAAELGAAYRRSLRPKSIRQARKK